jgi:hypothetical protein
MPWINAFAAVLLVGASLALIGFLRLVDRLDALAHPTAVVGANALGAHAPQPPPALTLVARPQSQPEASPVALRRAA